MTTQTIETEFGPHQRRIARAIRFLSDHYLEQPKLEDAAAAAALSPYHFQRIFTRYVGVSPKAFVGALTLDHAKVELLEGASVLDAALDAGLSGPSRLHDLSLKIEAMTPGEYARGGAGVVIDYGFHDSPFGTALVMATGKGLCGVAFGDEGDDEKILADMMRRWPKARYGGNPSRTSSLANQIFELRGDMPLHLMGTPWQTKVWQALLVASRRASEVPVRRAPSALPWAAIRFPGSSPAIVCLPATAHSTVIIGVCRASARCWPLRLRERPEERLLGNPEHVFHVV